tara:strand:- start:391 stop:525 length:135 start_codon:yes stop_codon:yes gene_type:complete
MQKGLWLGEQAEHYERRDCSPQGKIGNSERATGHGLGAVACSHH